MGWIKRRFYYSWITFSVLVCATCFFPWFLPRESTSGLLGRWLTQETDWRHAFARKAAPVIDMLFHTPFGLESCEDTSRLEQASREALYIRGELG
jgi:hypothetical protein